MIAAVSSRCELLHTGVFRLRSDPAGEVEISPAALAAMVSNFDAGALGTDIFISVAMQPSDGAAGTITRLWVDGSLLCCSVQWTPYGVAALQDRMMRCLAAEFETDYVENERPYRRFGPMLIGAGLMLKPALPGLSPVTVDG